ncbi:MAG: hypothetical protein ACTHOU_10760 [Aureliella sp.]|jgi:hypothetical protein
MVRHVNLMVFGWLLSALLVATGCSEANPRKEISGKVTLKSAPLDEGVVRFMPLPGGSDKYPATQESGMIAQGDYKIPAEMGLTPGKYKVIITAGDSSAPADPDQPPGPGGNYVMKDRIPPEFNVNSKIEVEVTEEGPNQFNFDIP